MKLRNRFAHLAKCRRVAGVSLSLAGTENCTCTKVSVGEAACNPHSTSSPAAACNRTSEEDIGCAECRAPLLSPEESLLMAKDGKLFLVSASRTTSTEAFMATLRQSTQDPSTDGPGVDINSGATQIRPFRTSQANFCTLIVLGGVSAGWAGMPTQEPLPSYCQPW